jgi:hypothetical protein
VYQYFKTDWSFLLEAQMTIYIKAIPSSNGTPIVKDGSMEQVLNRNQATLMSYDDADLFCRQARLHWPDATWTIERVSSRHLVKGERWFGVELGASARRALGSIRNVFSKDLILDSSDGEEHALACYKDAAAENIDEKKRDLRSVFCVNNPMPSRIDPSDRSLHSQSPR